MEQGILAKLKMVHLADLLHIIKFLIALPLSRIYRIKHPDLWLICDYALEARDNPYWLFRYIRKQHKEQDVIYAIDKHSPDYKKVAVLGKTVHYGSLMHWICYLAATKNISSQKGGKPNAAVCYVLEVSGLLKNTRIFLQHGIIKDDLSYLYYKNTKMRMFVCSVPREFEFVRDHYGYPDGYVQMPGLCRYDNLFSVKANKPFLLVMPTWRKWIAHETDHKVEAFRSFDETEFAREWKAFLQNDWLKTLHAQGIETVFYLHRNMQKFSDYFLQINPDMTIATWPEYDCQQLMKEAICMVTDYSSVAMDFAYMRKPVVYYQFDYERFRKGHMGAGYFEYRRDGFGPVCDTKEELVKELQNLKEENWQMADIYKERCDQFFYYHDRHYCKRTYEAIQAID